MIIAILYSAHRMDCRVSVMPWETGNLALLITIVCCILVFCIACYELPSFLSPPGVIADPMVSCYCGYVTSWLHSSWSW